MLFGMPRSRVADLAAASQPGTSSSVNATSKSYLTNSNLNKVSDWLTTIIIGLGLVNLGSVIPAVQGLGTALKAPLGNTDYAGVIGISIPIASLIVGFILVYLWTSIRVRELLEDSEREGQGSLDTVPRLEGMSHDNARSRLGATSLTLISPVGARGDDQIDAQHPDRGDTVPAGSSVTVTLNREVPDVTTLTVRKARQVLGSAGFGLKLSSSARDDQEVAHQDPVGRNRAVVGSDVVITAKP
jgi:hypothetical protein